MSLKDIFNLESKKKNNLTTVNFQNLTALDSGSSGVESVGFIEESNKEFNRFIPAVDYSTASNFAKFGLAERYYEESINRVTNLYPFDGSLKEKKEWRNGSTPLDLYIFDNEYPKTTGYVNFSFSGWGTKSGILKQGYGLSTTQEYITFFNRAVDNKLENIYDESAKRRENTRFLFSTGSTIEFWLKKNSFADIANQTSKEVIFYSKTYDSDKRLVLYLSGASGCSSSLYTDYYTSVGTKEFSVKLDTGFYIADSTWHHYAVTYGSSSSGYTFELYVDGQYVTSQTSVGPIVNLTGAALNSLGALAGPVESITDLAGYGKLSGSIDEFRFWNTKRNGQQIGRYFITSEIGDGTNTDDANTDLGVHFKFNEGIIGDSATDSRVLDFSGRTNDGTFVGYSSNSRSTGSAIDDAGYSEPQDPIIYPNHPTLVSYKETKMLEGQEHDISNPGSLYKKFPAFMLDEDDQNGFVLRNLTQIMASYLDQLYLQIQFLPSLKQIEYAAEENKPHNFYAKALESAGFPVVDIFADIETFNRFLSRDEKQLFEKDFEQIKNRILQNIYNNLPYILKSKGNEKSFRNFIRCFGVDDNLYRINLYNNNFDYSIENRYRNNTVKKNYINFNQLYNTDAVVYSYPDLTNANSVGYISGTYDTLKLEENISNTYEIDVVFPEKPNLEDPNYIQYSDVTASLFGVVAANASSPTDTTIPTNNLSNFELYAVRPESLSRNVYFVLKSSYSSSTAQDNFYIQTDVIKDIYSDQRWNFAVRVVPQGYDISDLASPSSPTSYSLELYGVSVVNDFKVQEITASATIGYDRGLALLSKPRRLYVGSKKQNVTGSLVAGSDVKVSSVKLWFDYLSNDTIYNNSIQGDVDGNELTYKSAFLGQTQLSGVFIPKIDTLALNWKFNNVYSASASGEFDVIDSSSGSISQATQRYGTLGGIIKAQHTGRGNDFAHSAKVVSEEFLAVLSKKLPEQVSSDDTVQILNEDDLVFTKETRPIRTFISIERSMYQTISEEMLKVMSSINEFSNLIGERQNQYRHEYKDMSKLRSLFYESIGNTPDLDKFVDYYKWLDLSLSRVIRVLFPASADVSEEVNTMVESHVLERNKYKWKFPTMEFKTPDPEAGLIGVNKHLYDWKYGHAPIPLQQTTSSLWWNKRAERNGPVLSSSNAAVNTDKTAILEASYQVLNRSFTSPIRYSVDQSKQYIGGASLQNKKFDYYKPSRSTITISNTSVAIPPDTTDNADLIRKYDAQSIYSGDGRKFRFVAPFSYYQNQKEITGSTQTITTNNLDVYGPDYEIPLQGPFTEKYVGGNFHRHQELFSSGSNRAEAYVLSGSSTNRTLKNPFNVNTAQARSDFFREELVKRPVNIKNIAQTTGSTVIGNYDKKYHYFQTSDRNTNNPFFTKNGGIDSTGKVDPYVSNSYVWKLPTRTKTETIFVERFSAPGDAVTMNEGALDVKSAQFSSYNVLPFRNLNVRAALKEWLTTPNVHGYASGSSTTASFHKIPKNSYSNVAGSTNNDNFWIQHPVPQCDLNYAWINDSAASSSTCDNITFTSASSISKADGSTLAQPVVYTDSNFYVIDPINTSSNIIGLDSASIDSYINSNNGYYTLPNERAFAALITKRNAGYGYPSWRQVRTAQMPLAKYFRDNNILSTADASDTVTNYSEVPLTVNKTLRYHFVVSNYNNGVIKDSSVPLQISYFNNKEFFNNSELNDKYIDFKKLPEQTYEQIQKLLKSKESSPIKSVDELKYIEKLFPRKVNSYLGVVRSRTKFTETQSQKDAQINIRRTFWRDNINNRLRTLGSVNSQGNILTRYDGSLLTSSVQERDATSTSAAWQESAGELFALGGINRGNTSYATNADLLTASAQYVSYTNDSQRFRNNTYNEAGINPWYDTYDDYSKDIRVIGKDHSIIPEFRISEHMTEYVAGNDFNFNSKEKTNFLSMEGSSITSSANDSFYKVYSHSDFINNFASIEADTKNTQIENANKTIKVRMSAVKKLLPYNGFYPSSRLLQIAQLFSGSFSGTTTGGWMATYGFSNFPTHSGSYDGYANFFSMFFSPGIIFNTIKSGIAVDYPAHTGTIFSGNIDLAYGSSVAADYRIKFESVIAPNRANLTTNTPIGLMSYGGTFASSSWNGKRNNSLYELAINNFFGETIRFFLKDSTNQAFISSKQSEYKILDKNKTYYMDVSLFKNPDDFVMNESSLSDPTSGKGIGFGPPYQTSPVGLFYADPVYAAATPPYYHGKSSVRLSFKPTENRAYSPSEIVSSLTSSFFNACNLISGSYLTASSAASSSIMRIDASVNFTNISTTKETTYAQNGDVIQVADKPANSGYDVWIISPKMETPIFNYSDKDSDYDRGMWFNYKDNQGTEKEGIFLEISDPFPEKTNANDPLTGSLIDVCKFDKSKSVRKLGQLSETKEISEAIVAIPVSKNGQKYLIDEGTYSILQNPSLASTARPNIPRPSKALQDMYDKMKNYVFPPHLDFVNNQSVRPFGMYIFEFTHTLTKLDLAKMWQGVMPEIATKPELDEQVIEHGFGEGDIFNNKFDSETRWIIFKVKRKAENSYYNAIAGASQDTRFDFSFTIGGQKISAKKSLLPYSYNWPYDFFSLVELAKMEAEISYKKK